MNETTTRRELLRAASLGAAAGLTAQVAAAQATMLNVPFEPREIWADRRGTAWRHRHAAPVGGRRRTARHCRLRQRQG